MFINLLIIIGMTFWNAIEYDVLIDRADGDVEYSTNMLSLQNSLTFICSVFGQLLIGFLIDYSPSYLFLLIILFSFITLTYIPAVFSLDTHIYTIISMRCLFATFQPTCVLYIMVRQYLKNTKGEMSLLHYTMYSTCINQLSFVFLVIVGGLAAIYDVNTAWIISNTSIFTICCFIVSTIYFFIPSVNSEQETTDETCSNENWVRRSSRVLITNLRSTIVWMILNCTFLLYQYETITFVIYISRGPLGISLLFLSIVFLLGAVLTVLACIIFMKYRDSLPERTWIKALQINILICSSTFILCVYFAISDFSPFVLYAAITNICIQIISRQIVYNISVTNFNNAIQDEQRGKMTTFLMVLTSAFTFGLMQICIYTYEIRPEYPFVIMFICDFVVTIGYLMFG